jgi:hypothetical protein
LHLAQQATLETRDAKHEPRSLAEQRATWMNEAAAMLGGRAAVATMVQTALTSAPETAAIADARWVAQTADHILAVMEESRSTWHIWHVRAEVQRQIRTADVPVDRASVVVDLLIDEVPNRRSVALVPPRDGIDEPHALRRTNGSSVYTVAGADLYTSQTSCTRCSPAAGTATTSTARSSATATPHTVIRPDAVAPRTPTETLREILTRDDSPTSATTTLRELHDPGATGGPPLEPRADHWRQHLDGAVANELSHRLDLDQRSQQVRQRHHGDLPRLYQQPSSNRPPVPGR